MEPAGAEVPVVWRGRRAQAFVPTRLTDRDLALEHGQCPMPTGTVVSVPVLVAWILVRRLSLVTPPPAIPVSSSLATVAVRT